MRAVIADLPKHWLAEREHSDAARWDEVWNGEIHMPPVPTVGHQDLKLDLTAYLKRWWAVPKGNRVHPEVNLTTPADEAEWRTNFRIPDAVLLTPDRFHINKGAYLCGAPLVCVEVYSPGDESYEKLEFYGNLGVPEIWIIDRDSKETEVFLLQPDGTYAARPADSDGWVRSPATGIEFWPNLAGKLKLRLNGDPTTEEFIPVT